MLGLRLNTIHNVRYYMTLMASARSAIADGRFEAFRRAAVEGWRAAPRP
jgi:queuine tRNA-ribosyltransferase